ncbi:uncharacterized protein LOC117305139 [Asterias rubens]|uniref:uncharacterized protein LOC117305139 n=1 Tax=Asterias rubens TaxID=7604 RepID=UPI0014557F0D|nr:uncharacterized protein LOC117305139 [Asterias rubens]
MKAFCAVLLLAVCVARASAIYCYSCDVCYLSGVRSLAGNTTECSAGQDRCKKSVAGGVISRACAVESECGVSDSVAQCGGGVEDDCQICCDHDNCNGAVAAKGSLVGLTLALVTAAFSRYL